MKKMKFQIGAAVLAGLLMITTGCIDNEEAEGVKALREAQAELIQARANAMNLESEAQAAYDSIQNEIALVDLEIKQLEADLTAAELENDKALLSYELEAARLEQQKLVAQAERLLAEAEKELVLAMNEYDAAIALDESENKNLTAFLDAYKTAMNTVIDTREDIVMKQKDIVSANLYNSWYDNETGAFSSYIALQKEKKERELSVLSDWQTRYEAIVGNPSDMEAALIDAAAIYEELTVQIEALSIDEIEAQEVLADADAAYDEAYTEYSEAVDWKDIIDFFTDGTGQEIIPGDVLEEILNDPGHGDDLYYSIEYYEDEIAASSDAETIAELEADKGVVEDYIAHIEETEFDGAVSATINGLKNDYFSAKDVKNNADEDLAAITEEIALLTADRNHADNFLTALESDYDAVVVNLDDLEEDIAAIEDEIAAIDNDVTSWNDYLGVLETELEVLQQELEVAESEAAHYKSLVDEELGE